MNKIVDESVIKYKNRTFIVTNSSILEKESAYLLAATEVFFSPYFHFGDAQICTKVSMYDIYKANSKGLDDYIKTNAEWYPIEFIKKLGDPLVKALYGG